MSEKNEPDLLVTDVSMPQINGLEVVRVAHEMYPLLCSIIVSGYEDFDWVREALKIGSTDYLLKPIDKQELFKALECSVGKMHAGKFSEAYISVIYLEPLFQRLLEGDEKSLEPLLHYMVQSYSKLVDPRRKKIVVLFNNEISKVTVQTWLYRNTGLIFSQQ